MNESARRQPQDGAVPVLEQLVFGQRALLLVGFFLCTLFLGWHATRLQPDASFEKMIPMEHPYIQAMMRHIADLGAAGTTIAIVVEPVTGDIFNAEYMEVVRLVTDELFYLPGVDRNRMRSMWTPNVRWTEVTEQGFEGDKVIDARYDGSAQAMERLRANLLRSGELGRLVATDYRSSIVEAPLFDRDPRTGEAMDYAAFSAQLETDIRQKYQSDTVRIRIVGFAKMVGDLLDGIRYIVLFAAITLVVTAALLFLYSRSAVATLVILGCSLIAVVWQLGLLQLLGFGLNAYSILVPFLVFAIGVSHGVQMINAVAVNSVNDASAMQSSRLAFRGLYVPGMTALVSDAAGFITMLLIPIAVIRDLGVAASVGVAVIILTNLVLLPIIMSWLKLGAGSVSRLRAGPEQQRPHWEILSQAAQRRGAKLLLGLALGLAVLGLYQSQYLQIGDLDAGAPELRPDSRYNLDSNYVNEHYSTSSDVLVVMVETEAEQCAEYDNMALIEEFSWALENVPGVESVMASSRVSRMVLSGYNEGSLKWSTVTRNQAALNSTFNRMPEQLMNADCSLSPVVAFLADHKAATLERVLAQVEDFALSNNTDSIRFVPASGSAGIEAATNQEIERSQLRMIYLVYGVVALLVFLSFRSWRAVVIILLPLALTSILCQALMAQLGIGVKVATLPVIALGVGVGVDYGIYVYARLMHFMNSGLSLAEAYRCTLYSTGKAVAFTGITLAIGVATWIWSPIKFQADMGMLLTFMFLLNMVGALTLLPALATYLLPNKEMS
ncbi:RND family transporter [Halieaceae bacterium IMCC14734]|uniref:RND family transporter n=1 Tax=Candidatus Litorirhabdus singularis TaxID=2518993 RepID=A0ABT3TL75_9GAMM|nr:MMPL family transporter [Candidatus Litorirhabdus singularis]MCX2983073.1 RND family transporter [Candidatus Litorirhabdus singularis]